MIHAMLAIMMSFVIAERDPLCPKFTEVHGSDSMIQQDLNLLVRDEATFRKLWCMHAGLDPSNERDLRMKAGIRVDFEKQMAVCIFRFDKRMPDCVTALSNGKRVIRLIRVIERNRVVGIQQEGVEESEADKFKPCNFAILIFPKDAVGGFEQDSRWIDWRESMPRTLRASRGLLRTDTLEDLKK